METKLRLGVLTGLGEGPDEEFRKIRDLGLSTCQVCIWDPNYFTDENARAILDAADTYGVEVTTLWTGWPGPAAWNFIEGPSTLGLVPSEYRAMRLDALKKGADFAVKIDAPSITTHVGFIPENPSDPAYVQVIDALKEIAGYCKDRGIGFWFETGQETPVTLLRAITDIGTGNLGINLDPANLLMYGKANPVDALDVFGTYVRGVHAKDGEYPTNPRELGVEKRLGDGRVNYPALIPKLKACGFTGALTIEREISGPQQVADIRYAIDLLSPLT